MALLAPVTPEIPPAPVRWDAPPGCPDLDRVQARISDLLGRSVEPGELEMQGRIDASAQGWTLTLTTKVGNLTDERSLDANDCTVLADAAALVAVVMLDPVVAAATIERNADEASEVPSPPPDEPPPTPPAPLETDPPPETDPEPEPLPTRRPSPARPFAATRVRAGGEFGAVPGGTGVFDLGVAVGGWGPGGVLRAELVGSYSVGRPIRSDNATVRIHLGSATPRLCASIDAGPIQVPLCAGLEIGAMRATSDAPAGGTTNTLWLAFQAEPGVRWAFSPRASLWVSGQVFVPLRFPDFELTDPVDDTRVEAVYSPPPVGVRGLAGIELQFGGR